MATTQSTLSESRILLARLQAARTQTDRVFALLAPETLFERPIAERHRVLFYIGHLEAFDLNLFGGSLAGLQPFHPSFDQLFAFGIDPVGGGLPDDQPSDWPSLDEINAYAQRVRSTLDQALNSSNYFDDLDRDLDADHPKLVSPRLVMNASIEHRLMHAETLAYMLHQFPVEKKRSPGASHDPAGLARKPGVVRVPPGTVRLGRVRSDGGDFGWDNEYDAHVTAVEEFEIDRYKVTNGEFLEFFLQGGYQERSLWSDADWEWKQSAGIEHPVYWKREQGSEPWRYHGMFAEIPLPLDWPVWVSMAEASAYAKWAGKALPSEAQWQRAAYGGENEARMYPWGSRDATAELGNFDFARWDPAPVTAYPDSASPFGAEDLLGNGWEWTSTPFGPFEGFKIYPFYPGYSANFFDGRHFVLKGGSPRTAACMLRRSFRNWFQPHYQYVYAGFRCVKG